MRGVSKWASRVAPLVVAFLVLGAASAWAQEPPPTEPPQARMNPPVGVISQARMQPPVGAPDQMSLLDMFLTWLQSRTIGA